MRRRVRSRPFRRPPAASRRPAAGGCQALAQLGATTSLAIAPAGDALYAAGAAGGLVALTRQAPPTCLSRELRAGVGVPTQILMPCTDPNGDTLTYAIASKPAHGILRGLKGGSVTYRPKPGYRGLDAFGITVSDGSGGGHQRDHDGARDARRHRPRGAARGRPAEGARRHVREPRIGCDARTAGGCTGTAILRLGGPAGPIIAPRTVRVAAGKAHTPTAPGRPGAPRSSPEPGARPP